MAKTIIGRTKIKESNQKVITPPILILLNIEEDSITLKFFAFCIPFFSTIGIAGSFQIRCIIITRS